MGCNVPHHQYGIHHLTRYEHACVASRWAFITSYTTLYAGLLVYVTGCSHNFKLNDFWKLMQHINKSVMAYLMWHRLNLFGKFSNCFPWDDVVSRTLKALTTLRTRTTLCIIKTVLNHHLLQLCFLSVLSVSFFLVPQGIPGPVSFFLFMADHKWVSPFKETSREK